MLIEGCSGGGGRFDAGMLYYTPQIWTSDDTDAIERLKIQYGTSFAYPVSTMGAHVSASPNHQTGRAASLATRATVAMAGTFGYELDPAKLTDCEKEEVREQIRSFKEYYSLIQDGTYYRLASPYENEEYTVWEFVNEDMSEALLGICLLYTSAPSLCSLLAFIASSQPPMQEPPGIGAISVWSCVTAAPSAPTRPHTYGQLRENTVSPFT